MDVSFKVIEKQPVGGKVIKVYDNVQCSYLKEHKCEYIPDDVHTEEPLFHGAECLPEE